MNWQIISTLEQRDELKTKSFTRTQVIFKHSTRCSVSSMVKNRLEKSVQPDDIDFHYLDLIHYRSLSNKIAKEFNVHHVSPQVLLIKKGECVFDESHMSIQMDEILEQSVN